MAASTSKHRNRSGQAGMQQAATEAPVPFIRKFSQGHAHLAPAGAEPELPQLSAHRAPHTSCLRKNEEGRVAPLGQLCPSSLRLQPSLLPHLTQQNTDSKMTAKEHEQTNQNNPLALYHKAHKEVRQKAKYLQLCYLLKMRLVQTKHSRKDTWKAFPRPFRKGQKTLALQSLQIPVERNDLTFLLHLLLEIRK